MMSKRVGRSEASTGKVRYVKESDLVLLTSIKGGMTEVKGEVEKELVMIS